jgi:hypothetical protein
VCGGVGVWGCVCPEGGERDGGAGEVLCGVRAQLVGVGYIGNLQIIILAKSPRGPGEILTGGDLNWWRARGHGWPAEQQAAARHVCCQPC